MNACKPEHWTAEYAYAQRSTDIERLQNLINSELDVHAKRAQLAGNHWGYPGDLSTVRDGLQDIAAFLSGRERVELERWLDDRPSPTTPTTESDPD